MIIKSPVASGIPFDPTGSPLTSIETNAVIIELYNLLVAAAALPIFTITCQHNGTVGGNTFLGYNELISGDSTPLIIPRNCDFTSFTFSNQNSSADYKIEFRKNSLVATPFYTTASKVNVQFFSENVPAQSFVQGDQIYVKYIDEGQNASDVGMSLSFKAV